MNKQMQVNILQRVRKFLGVDEECSASELYSRLREYRNQMHPDRFTEDEAKEHAEAKFKEAQQLLPELFRYVQDEALHRTPAELALYKPVYDHVFTQAALDAARSEIDDLKQQLEWRENEVERLEGQLNDRKNQEFDAERRRLEKLYKPGGRTWASLGITLVLSGALAIMTKMEDVSAKLKQYSPVDEKLLNNCTFGLFLLILLLAAKRFVENVIMRRRVREVCSVKAPIDFLNFLSGRRAAEDVEHFSEYEVYEFLGGNALWWKRALGVCGFVHFQIETIDELKSFFISSLLKKELISISYAEGLDRRFSIRKKRGNWDK